MKNRILTYVAVAIAALVTFSSCDDYLTQSNPNTIIVDNYWKNLDDCEMGMITVYNQLRRQNAHQIIAENLRSGMGYPGLGRPTPTNTTNARFYNQVFGNTDQAPNQKWAELYMGIFRANQVIRGLEGIKDDMSSVNDKQKWKDLMAEARFFRGYFHYWVASSFNKGEVIIYDFVPEDEANGDFYQGIQSEQTVRNFYRKDLKYAFDSLPAVGNRQGFAYGERATRYSAAFALAQSYLSQPVGVDYDSAKIYLEDIIQSGYFELSHIKDNMTTDGENNSESILEIAYDRNLKPEAGDYSPANSTYSNYAQQLSSQGGWRTCFPSCWLIMAYKDDEKDLNDDRNFIDIVTRDEEQEDGSTVVVTDTITIPYNLRASYSIALPDDSLEYYGDQPSVVANFQYSQSTANYRKLTNWDICTNENELNARSGVNYRLMRLADVYLMYSECLIKGGTDATNTTEAIKYVNKVRHRAGLRLLGTVTDGEWPELGDPTSNKPLTYIGDMVDFRNIVGQEDSNFPIYDPESGLDQRVFMNIKEPKNLMMWMMHVERPLELSMEGMDTRLIDIRRWSNNLEWFNTREYFRELSSRRYYGEHFKYINTEGNEATRWQAVLKHGIFATDPNRGVYIDFTQAAQNYIEDVHAYWPLPTEEVISNPNL
ncbi:RagB/SusD family nutrient uptake outer membrane protein [Saccharicrinis aurantiacus]|uniref:RagB/SusD family nutrient uptake outer membrane protein n=1 Tax=Saccharicrinis aurantiacus TaxID=1849719 RepID=UPI00094F848E|nr:RagB/SusD family nutrient uptake outer membrane protein [Saccharicrinis aurantiacus]